MNLDQFKFTNEQKDFVNSEIVRISSVEKKSQIEQIIFDLVQSIQSENPARIQLSSFERILKNEFKKHKAKLDLDKIKEDEKKFLADLKKDIQAKNAKDRKKREHSLISIGALFDMVSFPTDDKGIITGMLLNALEQSKSNPQYLQNFKIKGDEFITQRENEKKSKSTIVNKPQP